MPTIRGGLVKSFDAKRQHAASAQIDDERALATAGSAQPEALVRPVVGGLAFRDQGARARTGTQSRDAICTAGAAMPAFSPGDATIHRSPVRADPERTATPRLARSIAKNVRDFAESDLRVDEEAFAYRNQGAVRKEKGLPAGGALQAAHVAHGAAFAGAAGFHYRGALSTFEESGFHSRLDNPVEQALQAMRDEGRTEATVAELRRICVQAILDAPSADDGGFTDRQKDVRLHMLDADLFDRMGLDPNATIQLTAYPNRAPK